MSIQRMMNEDFEQLLKRIEQVDDEVHNNEKVKKNIGGMKSQEEIMRGLIGTYREGSYGGSNFFRITCIQY